MSGAALPGEVTGLIDQDRRGALGVGGLAWEFHHHSHDGTHPQTGRGTCHDHTWLATEVAGTAEDVGATNTPTVVTNAPTTHNTPDLNTIGNAATLCQVHPLSANVSLQ